MEEDPIIEKSSNLSKTEEEMAAKRLRTKSEAVYASLLAPTPRSRLDSRPLPRPMTRGPIVVLYNIHDIENETGYTAVEIAEMPDMWCKQYPSLSEARTAILDRFLRTLKDSQEAISPLEIIQQHLRREFHRSHEPLDKVIQMLADEEDMYQTYQMLMNLNPWLQEFEKSLPGYETNGYSCVTGDLIVGGAKPHRPVCCSPFTIKNPFLRSKIICGETAIQALKNPSELLYYDSCGYFYWA